MKTSPCLIRWKLTSCHNYQSFSIQSTFSTCSSIWYCVVSIKVYCNINYPFLILSRNFSFFISILFHAPFLLSSNHNGLVVFVLRPLRSYSLCAVCSISYILFYCLISIIFTCTRIEMDRCPAFKMVEAMLIG